MVATTELDTDLLPDSAREIADAVGLDAAMRLIDAYGGSMLYVPKEPTAELRQIMGAAAAATFCDLFYAGSDRLSLPRCARAMRAVLHRQICAAYNQGATAGELARHYRCTERWVFEILARRRAELADQQADLF